MMKLFFVVSILFILPGFAEEGKRPDPPEKIGFSGHFRHAETGVVFPDEIEGLKANYYSQFKNVDSGVGVRYEAEAGTRADVYISNRGMVEINNGPGNEKIIGEIQDAVAAVRRVAELGHYSDVQVPDQANVKNRGGLTMISLPFTYKAKPEAPGAESELWQSCVSVTVYRDHFFKIRYSSNGEENEEQQGQQDAFIESVFSLIIESSLFPQIDEWLNTYFEKGPLSEEGRDVAGGLLGFIENSKLVHMKIDTKVMPWFSVQDYPDSETLLAGYIVGNLRAQLESGKYTDEPLAGVKQSLRVYEELVESGASYPRIEAMEKFLNLEKQGKLQAHVYELMK